MKNPSKCASCRWSRWYMAPGWLWCDAFLKNVQIIPTLAENSCSRYEYEPGAAG